MKDYVPGRRMWVIAEGYLLGSGPGPGHAIETGHEAVCILNAGPSDAHVRLTLYFRNRDPAGPYELTVPARRTRNLRYDDLTEPEPVPRDTDYASVLLADEPVVVHHMRLDSRQSALALLPIAAYSQ